MSTKSTRSFCQKLVWQKNTGGSLLFFTEWYVGLQWRILLFSYQTHLYFRTCTCDFFLINWIKHVFCFLKESSLRNGSFKYRWHMVWYRIKGICYYILPILKYFQNFAYSLFYAWAIHLWIKRICHRAYFFRISYWSLQHLTNFLEI